MPSMLERFDRIRDGLAVAARLSGREASAVSLVAVSKWHTATRLSELACYWKNLEGCANRPAFGENYVQEAASKIPEVERLAGFSPCWHFIGHIQSRKAKDISGRYGLIHSLDSLSLAKSLVKEKQKREEAQGESLPCEKVLVQVNIGEEPQKSGVAPANLPRFLDELREYPGMTVEGLMCLPPDFDEAERSRPFFSHMRELAEKARAATGLPLPHLSMGMSHDYRVAIEEGATIIRVGTAIFGPRQG